MFCSFNFSSACAYRIDNTTKTMSKFMFIKVTKLYSKWIQVDHKYEIVGCFFVAYNNFLKMLIDLAFLIPTLSLFHSFIQYGKKVALKGFVLVGGDLIIKADDDLSK